MDMELFYEFRSEVRKKLGRIYFFPQNIDLYAVSIVELFLIDTEITKFYLSYCTKNEKKYLLELAEYLQQTKKNLQVAKIIISSLSSAKNDIVTSQRLSKSPN